MPRARAASGQAIWFAAQVMPDSAPVLDRLDLPGTADAWQRCGFELERQGFVAGAIAIRVGEREEGEAAWGFSTHSSGTDELCGIAFVDQAVRRATSDHAHPNGVVAVDHVVVASDRPAATRADFDAAGFEPRRPATRGSSENERSEVFFWSGPTLIELVGPVCEAGDGLPRATIWGVTFVVNDIAVLSKLEGSPVGEPRAAVQPGRQIAIARAELRLGLGVAFISPHVKQ